MTHRHSLVHPMRKPLNELTEADLAFVLAMTDREYSERMDSFSDEMEELVEDLEST